MNDDFDMFADTIKEDYPNMTDDELEIEFMTRMWMYAATDQLRIFRNGDMLSFAAMDADMTGNPLLVSENEIPFTKFFDDILSGLLISGIASDFVYVLQRNGETIFVNSYDIKPEDRPLNKHDATKVVIGLTGWGES